MTEVPEMKMWTDTPIGVPTPDLLETRLGKLRLSDGVPTAETAELIYDNLDFQRGVQAFLHGIQIASMSAMRKGMLEFGPPNETVLVFETLMDSKALWLTPNTTNVYNAVWLELSDKANGILTAANIGKPS